jgi:nucleoside-diphosphate-sugar epimerase
VSDLFVTGATGVLGRAAVPELLRAGHRVRGVARSREKAELLARLGAEPVAVDLFDGDALKSAIAGCEGVLHLATSIPPMKEMRKRGAWAMNDRLRSEATARLVDAALANGVELFVAESITFPYSSAGDHWITEDSPYHASGRLEAVAALEAHVARVTAEGGRGVSLRFAGFVGPDARATDEALAAAGRRVAPVFGRAGDYMSTIHTDDAGRAVAAAVAVPAGAYNIADDEPLTRKEFVAAFTRAFGLGRLYVVPMPIVKLAASSAAEVLARSQRVSSERFRAASGWRPRFPSAREAWNDVARRRARREGIADDEA